MARCLISFGANLGVPAVTIGQAAVQIKQLLGPRLRSFELSRPVRTPAVGGPTGQPPFVNAVAALNLIDCTAWDVWHIVREVEHALGRVRQERWEARRIDLDVLMFAQERIWTPQFKLPHPRMIMRRFILQPALDVAADWIDPVSGWTIERLAQALSAAPASIVLVSHDLIRDRRLVENAADVARCELINVELQTGSAFQTPRQRWLGLVSASELLASETPTFSPTPRLVCVLAPPTQIADAAWEDVNRKLARWLDLCPSRVDGSSFEAVPWLLNGPRYLLSTDDMAWAQHEIVAALDAMDCPVEPINS